MQLFSSKAWISESLAALSAHSAYFLSEDVALFVVSQLLAPHAARVLAAEQAAEEASAAEATVPRRAADTATAEETPPLELTAPLQVGGPMTLRSPVTGLWSPVLGLVQGGRLCVFDDAARLAALPAFKVDLRGATVSNPLHSPAAGSRSARILLRERDGRTHEMAAPSAAEAGAWVGDIVHVIAAAARDARAAAPPTGEMSRDHPRCREITLVHQRLGHEIIGQAMGPVM
mmetsp:Transcript_20534/g.64333  ORF Transcript_20534/g.64333 Transcript_20534/m.64333 type:complete len:231 (-) Transcript_20534:83-775(-)